LGGLIYIRPGMARVPSFSFCKFSFKWIAILWKQKPNERGLPKQRHVYHRNIDYHRSNHYKQRCVDKTSSLQYQVGRKKTKVNTLVLQSQLIDRVIFFANEKKWRVCSIHIWF
jgi:hypothetical protein